MLIADFLSDSPRFHGEPRYRMRSMLFVEDGKVIIQNARRLCTGYMGLPRSSDIPPITEAQAEAIDALHFLAERYQLKLTFQKGDIQYINNLSMFHARDGFTETAEQKYVFVVVSWALIF
jgi:hypothetical protein